MRKVSFGRACANYHSGLCCPFIDSVVSNDSAADALADWDLRCPQMPEDTFLPGAAHILGYNIRTCLYRYAE